MKRNFVGESRFSQSEIYTHLKSFKQILGAKKRGPRDIPGEAPSQHKPLISSYLHPDEKEKGHVSFKTN